MEGQGTRLLRQIDEYMQLARLDAADASPLDVQDDVDVAGALVEGVVSDHAEEARARSMAIDVTREDDLPTRRCDAGLVRIALSNLVRNAIKYGHEGGRIEIAARRSTPSDALELAVWNEGPGFHESERHKLFRRFSRLSAPELRTRPGTGLGLYLAARIAALHGGSIDATSEPGSWAHFAFRLP
jgi:signal transduction histidine kinase